MNKTRALILLVLILPLTAWATDLFSPLPQKQLSADQAFQLSAQKVNDTLLMLHWEIKPGFMLYQQRITVTQAKNSNGQIGEATVPPNDSIQQLKIDGHPVFSFYANAYLPIKHAGNGTVSFYVRYQGCQGKNYCYPPVTKLVKFNLNTDTAIIKNAKDQTINAHNPESFKGSTLMILLSFLGLGILLSFTPCVLPMLPILWKIITGHEQGFWHALTLGLAYTLSMAVCFSVLGIVAASLGHSLQGLLQTPWLIGLFSLIILVMALAQFDVLRFNIFQGLDNRLQGLTRKTKAGSLVTAVTLGALTSLVLSPCVSAPLIAILLYIANTGNLALGGMSLFSLAIGMNIPLLLVALAGLKILPKTGGWMNTVKHLSGFILLALAAWLLDRVIPSSITLILYGLLALAFSIYCARIALRHPRFRFLKGLLGLLSLAYAIALFTGASLGHSNPLRPLQAEKMTLHAKLARTKAELNRSLAQAKMEHKAVMIDFYADWCVACQLMDKQVFSQTDVQQALKPMMVIRIDLTHNSEAALAIAKRYHVFAPPSLVFYNAKGKELANLQIFGDTDKTSVLHRIQLASQG
ncbi:MAG: hypothetical protein COV52_08790 [Gammaproteobacteria bacterium CG11_big_fil_rev_8_21_14_0_20_46_22]|nr:MAG: hypothetical protein COW05_09910 [Gammaproteobacteria bacterium CG12_big_fil_rev_8_21_14_0_65_46_12]PIR10376.1 MAG: hypothetical protein COV52_08790 [Gammaproteobacteria bacterium CG11_big_fil_rev_8_21_14_0_20_46_22]